jgi:hypothetical protein
LIQKKEMIKVKMTATEERAAGGKSYKTKTE